MIDTIILIYCSALVITQVIIDMHRREFNIFNIKYIFQAYYIIQLPFSSFVISVLDIGILDSRLQFFISNDTRLNALLLMAIGHTVFVLGDILAHNFKLKLPRLLKEDWKTSKSNFLIWGIIILGYICFFYLIKINGGISLFLTNIDAWRTTGMIGQGFLLFPMTSLLGVASMIYIISHKQYAMTITGKIKFLFLLMICILPSLFLHFRGYIFSIILESFIVYNIFVKKISTRNLILVGGSMVIAITFYGIYREYDGLSITILQKTFKERPDLLGGLFLRSRGSEIFCRVIDSLSESPDFLYGISTMVECLTIFIPHFIWPGKPIPKSILFSNKFFNIESGVSPTILSELYWDYGCIGMIITMFMIGFIMRLISNTLLAEKNNKNIALIYGIAYYMAFLFAEALSGTLNTIVLNTVFLIPILLFLNTKFRWE